MAKSKVYFSDLRTRAFGNLPTKLKRLIKTAGIGDIDLDNKYVALKISFGEPGNWAYLRPNYIKTVADVIKELGGRPFLLDCNTLYIGRRKNALDHIEAAYENGFNPFSTGCHVIIGDGLKGTDETIVPINGEYVKEAKLGTGVVDSDVIITISHFKGHESAGFGGAIKNLAMGCGSRAGKMEMHSSSKPTVNEKKCKGCGMCLKICAHNAITFDNKKAYLNENICVGCGRCIGICPTDAMKPHFDEAKDILNFKMAEYAYAVVKEKPNFHISLVIDVSPDCDCHSENDIPIVPDVGMFASFDPVALDMACVDAVNKQPIISGCIIDRPSNNQSGETDHFGDVHPDTHWISGPRTFAKDRARLDGL